jgi:uncharacterized membrane protein YhaH (DUF805 family)
MEASQKMMPMMASATSVSTATTLGVICFLILIGVTAWFLIALGMLKDTPGPNRFGPDPLSRTDVKMQPMGHA